MAELHKYEVGFKGREEILLVGKLEGENFELESLNVIGCPETLKLAKQWRGLLKGRVADIPLPAGNDHSSILIRELILKMQNLWELPYKEDELCHCRVVPREVVDGAIIGGANSVRLVGKRTSAGTGCGTCRKDIQNIIDYRYRASK